LSRKPICINMSHYSNTLGDAGCMKGSWNHATECVFVFKTRNSGHQGTSESWSCPTPCSGAPAL
jgi:hypothetical protein